LHETNERNKERERKHCGFEVTMAVADATDNTSPLSDGGGCEVMREGGGREEEEMEEGTSAHRRSQWQSVKAKSKKATK
jgi:hypothetical protein